MEVLVGYCLQGLNIMIPIFGLIAFFVILGWLSQDGILDMGRFKKNGVEEKDIWYLGVSNLFA